MSDIRRLLFEMEEHPEDFKEGEFRLTHKPTGQEFWVANGFFFYGTMEPNNIGFTFADKIRFGIALLKWRYKLGATRPQQRDKDRQWLRQHVCKKDPS